MAEVKTVSFVPLTGMNYPTWKVQCRMALAKDVLWGIVNETEVDPGRDHAEAHTKFMVRRDGALAIIVLSIEPSLFYLMVSLRILLCGESSGITFKRKAIFFVPKRRGVSTTTH